MKLYIIGICGTFMGGLARLAHDLGHQVSGSDSNSYPPMSTQLESLGIELFNGYQHSNVPADVDLVLVGNTISRGNPELEQVLNRGTAYTSGAQWLSREVLQNRWVLAVAGTHGKTTTASILAWILEDNQMAPGYLIGGVPENFGESARLGNTDFFVIEADEYDTAFCDKRSKFVHYQPRTLVLNNLEFDHADIFEDLSAIQQQFNHLLKIIPGQGQIIYNQNYAALQDVIDDGCWSELRSFGQHDSDWRCEKTQVDASRFEVIHKNKQYPVDWSLIGDHNMHNALAAIAAAHHIGVPVEHSVRSLATFKSVKRRLEMRFDGKLNNLRVRVFDDFAHHPTAINETLTALRNSVGDEQIIAVLEPRSNTMKRGIHKHLLAQSLQCANNVLIYADDKVLWDISELETENRQAFNDTESLLETLCTMLSRQNKNCSIVIMSNGGFENLHQRLIDKLSLLTQKIR